MLLSSKQTWTSIPATPFATSRSTSSMRVTWPSCSVSSLSRTLSSRDFPSSCRPQTSAPGGFAARCKRVVKHLSGALGDMASAENAISRGISRTQVVPFSWTKCYTRTSFSQPHPRDKLPHSATGGLRGPVRTGDSFEGSAHRGGPAGQQTAPWKVLLPHARDFWFLALSPPLSLRRLLRLPLPALHPAPRLRARSRACGTAPSSTLSH